MLMKSPIGEAGSSASNNPPAGMASSHSMRRPTWREPLPRMNTVVKPSKQHNPPASREASAIPVDGDGDLHRCLSAAEVTSVQSSGEGSTQRRRLHRNAAPQALVPASASTPQPTAAKVSIHERQRRDRAREEKQHVSNEQFQHLAAPVLVTACTATSPNKRQHADGTEDLGHGSDSYERTFSVDLKRAIAARLRKLQAAQKRSTTSEVPSKSRVSPSHGTHPTPNEGTDAVSSPQLQRWCATSRS